LAGLLRRGLDRHSLGNEFPVKRRNRWNDQDRYSQSRLHQGQGMELMLRPQQAPYDVTLPLRNTSIMAHVVTPTELPRVIEILADSFYADPVWSWAFPEPQQRFGQLTQWWGLLLIGAQLNPEAMWISDGGEATSVWYPPGAVELTLELEAKVEPHFKNWLGRTKQRKSWNSCMDLSRTGLPRVWLTV